MAFQFDKKGTLVHLWVTESNASFSTPFIKADLVVIVLGDLVIQFRDNMTQNDRRDVQKFIPKMVTPKGC